jgi:hypothetical protein
LNHRVRANRRYRERKVEKEGKGISNIEQGMLNDEGEGRRGILNADFS